MNQLFASKFASVITGVLLTILFTSPAFAQKSRAAKVSAPAVMETKSSSTYSPAHRFEIASNQVLLGGIYGGGINSALAISTASGSTATFGISAEGAYNLSQDWQITVPFLLIASSTTTFVLAAGPQYNFGDFSRMNQFFVNLRPGIAISGGASAFVINATVGKRFELIPGLAYRPNFGISFEGASESATFILAPFALSFEI